MGWQAGKWTSESGVKLVVCASIPGFVLDCAMLCSLPIRCCWCWWRGTRGKLDWLSGHHGKQAERQQG